MKLELLRSRINVSRICMRKEKVSEKSVECFIDLGEGKCVPIKEVDCLKFEDGRYSIIFR